MNSIDHETLRDRMPDVAAGRVEWSTAETAHLAGCPECAAEWRLIRSARRLGVEVEQTFDGPAAARGVTARLRTERWRPWPGRLSLVGLAAAAALALMVLPPARSVDPSVIPTAVRVIPELDSLSMDELTLVAEAFETPLIETGIVDGQPLYELDSTQLERVLRSLEG